MNKNELVNLVSERIEGGKAAATNAVDAVFEAIQETVSRGEKVAITGFGVFEKVERAARTGRNPATGESGHRSTRPQWREHDERLPEQGCHHGSADPVDAGQGDRGTVDAGKGDAVQVDAGEGNFG